jgi:signal transduction histidine kinase/CheY-like chemotaxis protein
VTFVPPPPRRPPRFWHSLRWRLPFLTSVLFALVALVFLWFGYRQLGSTLHDAGGERARFAADQFASFFSQSLQQRLAELRRFSANAALDACLARPSADTIAAAREVLAPLTSGNAPTLIQLFTGDDQLVLSMSNAGAAGMLPDERPPIREGQTGFRQRGGVAYADTVVPVSGNSGGYLVSRRSISISPGPEVLGRMVGSQATIEIGNRSGDVWSDLRRVVPAPPIDLTKAGVVSYRGADGERRVGALAPLQGAPVMLWVGFPESVVLAPARDYLRGMLGIALLFVLIAVIVARLGTERSIAPLADVTAAAEAIASGDYTRRVEAARPDEIGRLADAFNTMTDHVVRDLAARETAAAERRLLEDQLRQSQKMEAVGKLAGGVAHDFNNLLTAILGYSSLLLDELPAGAPVRREIEQIQHAGQSAASLTQQLLAFSRRQILQPRVLDLNEVVRSIEPLLKRLISEDVDLQTRLSPSLAHVSADPGQIEQIIVNLAVNARDAMPGGGRLTIETADVVLDESYAAQHAGTKVGPHVMLAVSDTGRGMDLQTRERIFEPFFTTKRRGEGTGLGLATVYGIVKQSGGSIWVYSEPGHGAAFKVYLPATTRAVTQPPAVPASKRIDGTETILVAEDQPEVRSIVRTILTRHGYTVLEAADGEEALRMLREHPGPIHLLLTDVVMPSIGGPELVRRLRETQPAIKVLYTSGYTDDAIVRHGVLEAGIAFLEKPFTPTTLLTRVREALT